MGRLGATAVSKIMRIRFIVAALFGVLPLIAIADWKLITRASDGTEFHILDGSIEVSGTSRRASILILKPIAADAQQPSIVTYSEFDCPNRRYRILRLGEFDANGKSVRSFEEPTDWLIADPQAVSDSIFNAACYDTSSAAVERERRFKQLEEEERRAEQAEAQRERSLQQAEYGFCIADCSSRPGATLLACMARCARYAPR